MKITATGLSTEELLEFALIGLKSRVEHVQSLLDQLHPAPNGAGEATNDVPPNTAGPRLRRKLSAAGRRRIAAATRERWRKLRAADKDATKLAKTKK